ncbi:Protein of uncharacterised function (DUF421) [Raoultella planticola]|uniref:Protein of uncharacterized function (DUF421) n=1 Tax=Raoultella planticola TaxID=575 RepID=A0A485C781_RAOPL|nr:Protein of uncharacterised function (DUF421) [Raoultella planticola]
MTMSRCCRCWVVFVTLALLYRLIMWLMGKSEKLENLLEGKPIPGHRTGGTGLEEFTGGKHDRIRSFLWSLRINGVEQLGQVRLAILETNGQISLYYYADRDVKAGLSILPPAPIMQASPPFRATMNMPAYVVAQFLSSAPGINNYVRAAQMQNGRGPAGRKESPDSNYVGFMTSSRQILLCDGSHISWLLSFTRCGACH